MAIDPTLFGNPTEAANVPIDQFVATFDSGILNAQRQLEAAQQRYNQAQNTLQGVPTGIINDDARTAAQKELSAAATTVEQASKELTDAHSRKATAIERYSQRANVPQELKDRYEAMAKLENLNATQKQAEVAEFLNTAPERREQFSLTTQKARADTVVAQAQADVAGATTGIQKQEAQTRLETAQQQVKNLAGQRALTAQQARLTGSQADVAAAQAGVAPETAQATLSKAQADANLAQQQYLALKRTYDATTDEQAKRAVGIELEQKQTALDTANQQLEQAKRLMPLAIRQAGANVGLTEQTIAKNTLGTLYGLQDKAKEIANLIRNGTISDPQQGMSQLQDYISTTIQGTTPFERDKFLGQEETTRRGQDSSLAATKASTLGSAFSSALSTYGKLNDTVQPGSDAAGLGFVASQRQMLQNLNQFQPSTPVNSPLMQSMRPAAAPVAAASTGDAGHQITINIGGATSPTSPGVASPAPAQPAMLDAQRPATPADVDAIWQGHPHAPQQITDSMTAPMQRGPLMG